ncbi:MarR family winged helix-turn-helix transcriptional regulator [Allokutzneria sp. NRRL B-24872]|uniref:MarR family winged helix-turn-helix transcriptional regulator n=1 Tax=Allokutzneria sp. NRRL B-24872 TaxID=1137961 RepID=UPI000A3696A9|nr:MarR family transcriptional regulator [Allokutzneria sp. NRRL B-24872]
MTSAAELARALRPLVFRLYSVVRRQTPQESLSLTQSSVLGMLSRRPYRMSALAEQEGVRLPSMTELVGRLERMGLVERERDSEDGRVTTVNITPAGQRLSDELTAARERFFAERLSALDQEDLTKINAALPALYRLVVQPPRDLDRS